MATTLEIQQVYNLLAVNYPAHVAKLREGDMRDQIALWVQLLGDLPGEVLKAAALQHMAVSQWFPAVAELRQQAGSLTARTEQAAIEAWGEVTAAMASTRYYRYADGFHEFPKFANPVTQRVVDALGWGNLCGSEDGTADRARFLQGYDAIAKRQQTDRSLLPVVRDIMAQRSAGMLEARHVD
jgi:hypothetical protein